MIKLAMKSYMRNSNPTPNRADINLPRPLNGIKVLDLTSVLMGPYASQILGDMGADVIKVEPPSGDTSRQIGPGRHTGMGALFLNTNRSKRSICIDLKTENGKKTLLKLAKKVDVFLYNIRPQAMARLGLSYEAVSAVNKRLIYVGVFGFGQDGPYAAKAGYDDLMQGASTLSHLFVRSTGESPQYAPAAMGDRIAGMAAVNAILGAIIERSSSGLGQCIDVPMFEIMVKFIMSDHMQGLSFDPPIDQGGYPRLLARSRRPYKTKDSYICAMIYTDKQWERFLRLFGRENEMKTDPRLQSLTTRTLHIDDLYAEVERELGTRTTEEWLKAFDTEDIPSMPMHDFNSVFKDPHLKSIGYFTKEEHSSEGLLTTMREPLTWSRTQPKSIKPTPRHGEHTREILMEGGFSDLEINKLIESGAVFVEKASTQ